MTVTMTAAVGNIDRGHRGQQRPKSRERYHDQRGRQFADAPDICCSVSRVFLLSRCVGKFKKWRRGDERTEFSDATGPNDDAQTGGGQRDGDDAETEHGVEGDFLPPASQVHLEDEREGEEKNFCAFNVRFWVR